MTISPGPDPSAIPEPVDLRQDRPTPARMYDYFLGGKDNYAVDREAAERVKEAIPNTREIVWENRFFLQRAVRHLAAAGIDQFIDLGTGLPTQGNVHEIARQVTPSARVVYVDNDRCKSACAHARRAGQAAYPACGIPGVAHALLMRYRANAISPTCRTSCGTILRFMSCGKMPASTNLGALAWPTKKGAIAKCSSSARS